MTLTFSIAWTHITARLRQTLVGIFGVATGIGFSVMMAALMEGSQNDFINQLVDALPHISITDEQRKAPDQPANKIYQAAEILSFSSETDRRGIKNPYSILATLDAWIPGSATLSVQTKALIRSGGHDMAISVVGIDPRREKKVSQIETQMTAGGLDSLYKASNAIIVGDGLALKLGVNMGSSVALVSSQGQSVLARIVGIFHSGIKQIDDNQSYTLIKTAQILAGQTALINEIRVKISDVMQSEDIAGRIERQTGYKSVSWQEAHQDLLSAFQIRNAIMFMVVGAILLVASFGTYNIISTITHEKTRDIAILKSLGLREKTVRNIFVLEAGLIGLLGLLVGWLFGFLLCQAVGTIEFKSGFTDMTHLPILYAPKHYFLAGLVGLGSSLIAGYFPARKAAAAQPVSIIRGAS